jgi:hypothetical protein
MFHISGNKSPIIFAGLHERRAVQLYADAPVLCGILAGRRILIAA